MTDAAPSRRVRTAARVLVVDHDGAVLLLQGGDPHRPEAGTWWFTPGGGVHDGESLAATARRELEEETGLVVTDPGEVMFERFAVFDFEGERFHQTEHYFVVRTGRFEAVRDGWTDLERRAVRGHRWWTPADIAASDETFYPERLLEWLRQVRAS
jgi:8-oxo-dGTP pyrophosphatase MutT (NUDIX family)